ncbi:MAG TPA: DUF58 domain-containing protein [Thermoplasmata archaeon]|nr:DUF58 domain-containing protein [Thermoplasmata archaeon]
MRTPLSSGLSAAALLFLLAALATRRWEFILLALAPLAFLAFGSLLPPERPLVAGVRALSRDRLQVGSDVDVTLTLKNEGPPIDLLEILDALPPELALVQGTNHAVVCLPSGESLSLTYTLRPSLKGEYRIGPTRLRALDPLALGVEDGVAAEPSPLVVAPVMEDLRRAALGPRRTRPWFGHVTSRQLGPGLEFWGIREYVAGDEVRRINWKASARLDRIFSNVYEGERSGDVVILLDARRESAVGSATANAVEYGVRAALGVAEHVLASKNRVGLIVQRDVLDWVPPAFGRKQLYRILDHLVHVRAGGEWPYSFVSWILSRYFPRDALVVLISPLTDRTAPDAIANLVALGYDVAVISPSPLGIERRFVPPGSATDVAYRILALERENLLSQLRRVAQVVDWDPSTPLALPLRRMKAWPRPA